MFEHLVSSWRSIGEGLGRVDLLEGGESVGWALSFLKPLSGSVTLPLPLFLSLISISLLPLHQHFQTYKSPSIPFCLLTNYPSLQYPVKGREHTHSPVVQFSKHLPWSSEAGHPASRPSCGGTACPGGKILLPAPYTSSLHTHSRTLSFASFFLILSHPGYSFYILGCYIPCIQSCPLLNQATL